MTEEERRAARANWPVRKYRIGEEPSDVPYWLSLPPEDRLRAVAEIRAEYHAWRYGEEPRLQRVYRVVQRA